MNYLLYIEFAAENLQFYLWFKDYVKRFNESPDNEKSLAPPIDFEKSENEVVTSPKGSKMPKVISKEITTALAGTDFATTPGATPEKHVNPFEAAESPDNASGTAPWEDDVSTLQSSRRTDYRTLAATAYESADVKAAPCKVIIANVYHHAANHPSHRPAISGRDNSSHWHLRCRRHPSPAQPVFQGA